MTAQLSGVFPLAAAISLAQTPVPQINYKQLPEHPFEAHGLKIAIQHLNAGLFRMNLTNTTMSFIAFAPRTWHWWTKRATSYSLMQTFLRCQPHCRDFASLRAPPSISRAGLICSNIFRSRCTTSTRYLLSLPPNRNAIHLVQHRDSKSVHIQPARM